MSSSLRTVNPKWGKVAEIIVESGLLDRAMVERALVRCDNTGEDLASALSQIAGVSDEDYLKTVSLRLGMPYFTFIEGLLEASAAKFLSEEECRRLGVAPVVHAEDSLTVAVTDPFDEEAIKTVAGATGMHVLPLLTTRRVLDETIDRLYGVARAPAKELPVEEFNIAPLSSAGEGGSGVIDDQSAIGAVDMIMREGYLRKASDIHIESAKDKVRVRYRIDGALQDAHVFPKEAENAIIARIKILSKLDITETRVPQDGRFRHEIAEGTAVDVRVSTLPGIYGEKITMRLLITGKLKRLEELGFTDENLKLFKAAIHQPNGLVLVTGPTGSGKTSTLYSALSDINTPEKNIITLEDPVEYRLDRINQVETNVKTGLTFAIGLRAILRQDPNVILVGEIRDAETAEIAVQASITGHVVFSTLHTNDSVGTVQRLLSMGVEKPFLAAALRVVVAQRLMRRLCETCRKSAPASDEETALLGEAVKEKTFFVPLGCEDCGKTGYLGRVPIFELFQVNAEVREAIAKGATLDELRRIAEKSGMRSLRQDALRVALLGESSLAEVIRVTYAEE